MVCEARGVRVTCIAIGYPIFTSIRYRYEGPTLANFVGRAVECSLTLYLEACTAHSGPVSPEDEWVSLREAAAGTPYSGRKATGLISDFCPRRAGALASFDSRTRPRRWRGAPLQNAGMVAQYTGYLAHGSIA